MPLRKFKEETGRLDLHILSQLPWGSDCQKSKASPWEGHIHMQPRKVTFHQTPQEENDPQGCETRPSIYYKPKFIYKAATQLVKSYYPYSATLLSLCFYVGHSKKHPQRICQGKCGSYNWGCWPHFSTHVVIWRERWDHREEQTTSAQVLEFHRQENIFKELGNWQWWIFPFAKWIYKW